MWPFKDKPFRLKTIERGYQAGNSCMDSWARIDKQVGTTTYADDLLEEALYNLANKLENK